MDCKHPEAFVSIKNGKRICGLCGAVAPKIVPKAPKPAPKKGGKHADE